MANLHSIPELDEKGFRNFGLSTGAIIAALFGLLFPWILDSSRPYWPWFVFLALLIPAIVYPKSLAPVYKYWMKFGMLLSRITTPIILAIVFFLVFLPMGIGLKLLNKDPMLRKLRTNEKSYRVLRGELKSKTMENPF